MNEYSLLYYPGFHPNPIWLRRVLLLTDNVTRVVPTDVPVSDPEDLLALREAMPECLRSISPVETDITIADHEMPRLARAFAFLAASRSEASKRTVEISISKNGSISILGYMFLHQDKVSPKILEELRRTKLIFEGPDRHTEFGGFLVVDENASNLILSGLAENISRRMGLDTVTDKPISFALNSLNSLDVVRTAPSDGAQGLLLSSLASILVPLEVADLSPRDYRNLRDAYSSIRTTFKGLTVQLTQINRLNRIDDPKHLRDHVKTTASDFFNEYQDFRKTRYARGFKKWAPLYVTGLLSIVAAVDPRIAPLGVAGASLVIQIVQRKLDSSTVQPRDEHVFHMLAGMRKDIIRLSGVKQIV
jgi:hypothetical protein